MPATPILLLLPLSYLPIHTTKDSSTKQFLELHNVLKAEGVKVFELSESIRGIVERANHWEREKIINIIWGDNRSRPKLDELTHDHVLYGFPSQPTYDTKREEIILPEIVS